MSLDKKDGKKSIIKSKKIICPECGEPTCINISNFKISLFDCKNGHKINDISIDKFEKTQLIDQSKIICNICKEKNKSNTQNNEFYICNTCKTNLCPSCQNEKHDKTHEIIKYGQKHYICNLHNCQYISYCFDCKKDICMLCEKEHNNHKITSYGKIIPSLDNIKGKVDEFKKSIDKLKNNINEIINDLNKVVENLEIYSKINIEILSNFNNKMINYNELEY